MLHEYFSFPEKFLFFDLIGLDQLCDGEFGVKAEIVFLLDGHRTNDDRFRRLRFAMTPDTFRLGCTPVINLFSHLAEPIRADQTKPEYRVIPDLYRPDATEVYSVDSVKARSLTTRVTRSYRPFFSFTHAQTPARDEAFWYGVRRSSERTGDAGTQNYLSIVDAEFRPQRPPDETLLVEVTCTNRDVPPNLALQFKFDELEFRDSRLEFRFTQRPSRPLRPPLDRKLDWRLISHLGLSYLSLVGNAGDTGSADALREMLQLYNFSEDLVVHNRILAIRAVASRPHRARLMMKQGKDTVPLFCHGLAVDLDLDGSPFNASGVFLFACFLESFLGLYSPINSFTQLTATIDEGRRILKRWPPRAGEKSL